MGKTEDHFTVLSITFLMILSLASSVLNVFCITVIFRSQKLLKRASTYFILNLLFVQFYQSIVVIPFYAGKKYKPESVKWEHVLCVGFRLNYMISYYAGVLSVLLIAVDRFLATWFVLKYKFVLTRKRTFVVISFMWIYVISLCLLPFQRDDDALMKSYVKENSNVTVKIVHSSGCNYHQTKTWAAFMLITNGIIPYMTIIVLYKLISYAIKKFDIRVQKRRESFLPSNEILLDQKQDTEENNVITTLALILAITYFVLWSPSIFYNIIWAFCSKKCFPSNYKTLDSEKYIGFITKYVAFLDTLAAPIIYCFYHEDFRKLLRKRTFKRFKSSKKRLLPVLIDLKKFEDSKETSL